MLGHLIMQTKGSAANVKGNLDTIANADHRRDQIRNDLRRLDALSRRGLWGILLFLSLSAVVFYLREAGIFAMVPAEVKALFGEAPPAGVLHVTLGLSCLSALILIVGRRGEDGAPAYRWYNIGLPAVFYPLYIFSDPSGAHFPTVVGAGLTLLLVEHLTVTRYATRAIRNERARLHRLERWTCSPEPAAARVELKSP